MKRLESIREKLSSGALQNGLWSSAQQVCSMLANSVLTFVLVIAMPVEDYGIYAYAVALCAIGVSVMSAGLSGLAVKALILEEDANDEIVLALFIIRQGFAVLGFSVVCVLSYVFGTRDMWIATMIAAIALFGRALDAPELWYLSRLQSRKTAIVRIVVSVLMLVLRVALVMLIPNIWLLLVLYALEFVLAGGMIGLRYMKDPACPGLRRPGLGRVVNMLRQSLPLMLSGIANQINLRGDVVIISAMLGAASVGVYSAATRFSELSYFLPIVFMNASLPVLLRTRQQYGARSGEYYAMLQRSYDMAFWSGVVVAIGTAVVGQEIIDRVFGPEYAMADAVLAIQVWACPFIFMGAVYSKWIVAEGVLWSSLTRHSMGAAVNLGLNILLLPIYGIRSAAIAMVVSYIASSYLACFAGGTSRMAGRQMTMAICAPLRYGAWALRRGGILGQEQT